MKPSFTVTVVHLIRIISIVFVCCLNNVHMGMRSTRAPVCANTRRSPPCFCCVIAIAMNLFLQTRVFWAREMSRSPLLFHADRLMMLIMSGLFGDLLNTVCKVEKIFQQFYSVLVFSSSWWWRRRRISPDVLNIFRHNIPCSEHHDFTESIRCKSYYYMWHFPYVFVVGVQHFLCLSTQNDANACLQTETLKKRIHLMIKWVCHSAQ